jgi:segregation and condensation protein B
MEVREKKSLLEALLFISGEPVTLAALKGSAELPEAEIKQLLDELAAEYREKDGGVLIIEIANGYQMVTNPAHAQWVKKFKSTGSTNKLSLPAL